LIFVNDRAIMWGWRVFILTRQGAALTRCKDDLKEEILYTDLPIK